MDRFEMHDAGEQPADDEDIVHALDADREAVLDEEATAADGEAPAMYSDLVGLEADEGDVAEQSLPVPDDEDDRDRT